MAKLTIKDTYFPGLDGDYEIDLTQGFTKQEYFLMKQRVGVVAGDLMPGAPVDANVLTAFGIVILERAGKGPLWEAFMQTTDQQTVWDFSKEEAADPGVPPAMSPASNESESGKNGSSGDSTNGDSGGSPETSLPLIGSQA